MYQIWVVRWLLPRGYLGVLVEQRHHEGLRLIAQFAPHRRVHLQLRLNRRPTGGNREDEGGDSRSTDNEDRMGGNMA